MSNFEKFQIPKRAPSFFKYLEYRSLKRKKPSKKISGDSSTKEFQNYLNKIKKQVGKADINQINTQRINDLTYLHCAILFEDLEVVEFLLDLDSIDLAVKKHPQEDETFQDDETTESDNQIFSSVELHTPLTLSIDINNYEIFFAITRKLSRFKFQAYKNEDLAVNFLLQLLFANDQKYFRTLLLHGFNEFINENVKILGRIYIELCFIQNLDLIDLLFQVDVDFFKKCYSEKNFLQLCLSTHSSTVLEQFMNLIKEKKQLLNIQENIYDYIFQLFECNCEGEKEKCLRIFLSYGFKPDEILVKEAICKTRKNTKSLLEALFDGGGKSFQVVYSQAKKENVVDLELFLNTSLKNIMNDFPNYENDVFVFLEILKILVDEYKFKLRTKINDQDVLEFFCKKNLSDNIIFILKNTLLIKVLKI
eukprot:snap_masked-scaffold_23-processed-gene-2.39-mRNA-1 protein AED:1.00 eAED:1.00 QI:0/0/0/0/1/1/3/0/420